MDLLQNDGLTRTDMWCHSCSKNFIARLDFALDGNHVVECPHCGHHHYRQIKAGVVTGDRYEHDSSETVIVERRNVWKSETQPITTSVAHAFIREKWLNRGDAQ